MSLIIFLLMPRTFVAKVILYRSLKPFELFLTDYGYYKKKIFLWLFKKKLNLYQYLTTSCIIAIVTDKKITG